MIDGKPRSYPTIRRIFQRLNRSSLRKIKNLYIKKSIGEGFGSAGNDLPNFGGTRFGLCSGRNPIRAFAY
jgi:hypothetical protein